MIVGADHLRRVCGGCEQTNELLFKLLTDDGLQVTTIYPVLDRADVIEYHPDGNFCKLLTAKEAARRIRLRECSRKIEF